MTERTVHHGRNIKRIREIQGMKQEALALELGDDWTQKKISLLEGKEKVDDELLGEVAKALKVSPEAIKNFNEDAVVNNIQNNYDSSVVNSQITYQFNPIDKWVEALEENKRLMEKNTELYERLLKTEREKVELLERMLQGKN